MTDKISAELFGITFTVLAQNPNEENKALAKRFFDLVENYDFSLSEMCVDEALITLDLAERWISPKRGAQIRYFGSA